MKITISTTSQTLKEALETAGHMDVISEKLGSAAPYGKYLITIINKSGSSIFVDTLVDADTTNGVEIADQDSLSMQLSDLSHLTLIAPLVVNVDLLITA